jgi:cell division protein FtsW
MGRIDAWLDPWSYANNEGYQIVNSFYAFADGGVTGVGLGMSHQKYLYLPQPHNDLIFPIIGEEFGLIGAALVVVLFLLFLYAAFRIARNAPDLYGRLVAGAAATMIGFQAFLNMLCMVNLLPMTGKPLPFFSAGGSSIIVTLMLAGLILNVSLRSRVSDGATERRDELLIIEGGRVNSRSSSSSGGASRDGASGGGGQPLLKGRNSRQPAGAKAPPSIKSQFRKPPAPAQAQSAAKAKLRRPPARGVQSSRQQGARQQVVSQQTTRQQDARRQPERSLANPLLSLSPARNRGYDGRTASSRTASGNTTSGRLRSGNATSGNTTSGKPRPGKPSANRTQPGNFRPGNSQSNSRSRTGYPSSPVGQKGSRR